MASIERVLATLTSILKFEISDYCDLETVEISDDGEGALIAKDGSMATIIRYEGFKTIKSEEEFVDAISRFNLSAGSYLGTKGHQIQVVFDRDEDPTALINQRIDPCRLSAKRLQLDVGDLLDENCAVLAAKCCAESVHFVLWTRPSLLAPIEAKLHAQEKVALQKNVPPMKDAQNPLRTIQFLVDRHRAFVSKFLQDLKMIQGSATALDCRAALREVRASLYPDVTPPNWRPTLIGDPVKAKWEDRKTKDVSAIMPPKLTAQLLPLDAYNGRRGGGDGVTDTRAVRVGSRIYAPCFISTYPLKALYFESLFRDLNGSTTKTKFGTKPMPWRVSFLLEGDGMSGMTMKKLFAGILGLTAESNRNLVKAANALGAYKSDGGVVIKLQINAATWVTYGDEKELMLRRAKLVRALTAWGDANVNEETGDPTAGMTSCAIGLSPFSVAPATAVPLEETLSILPLSRPASPFSGGHVLFRSLDGKLLPYDMFSSEQRTWITLIFAGPGSGKSVLLNRLNVEMCWGGGLNRLPYICVIDIGISSSGFISLVQEALPKELQHLALYVRLQNTVDYTINPFDTMLGCREPLARERDYMANFLTMLVTSEVGTPEKGMRQFCGRVVDAMFNQLSDKNERGAPRRYTHGSDQYVSDAVETYAIEWRDEVTTWWEIVDALFAKGATHAAYRAQRYAMPTLTDAVRAASDPEVVGDFEKLQNEGISVAAQFKLMVSSAISEYPVFSGQTVFDVGEARLLAIDLNDVVTSGSAAAKKKAALMFSTARNLFVKKIAISEEDLPYVPATYRDYHKTRFAEIKEDFKRLAYDEYHKTGGDPMLTEQALTDGREGRKWGLEVILSSQLVEDFKDVSKIATTVLILDAGNVQTRKTIKEIFGLSEAEASAMVAHVRGPTPEGATFLAKFQTDEAESVQLFTSTMGPQTLWALATYQEDRTVRDALYKRLGPAEARRALAGRFPKGSCRSYVNKLRQSAKGETAGGWIDENVDRSLLSKLTDEIYDDWVAKQEGALTDG